jgi:hypothetical protein
VAKEKHNFTKSRRDNFVSDETTEDSDKKTTNDSPQRTLQNQTKMPSLDASGIAEYIRFDCCPRYFKLRFEGEKENSRRWPEAFKPISPLLYGAGKALEKKKVSDIQKIAAQYHDLSHLNPKLYEWSEAWEKSFKEIENSLQNFSQGAVSCLSAPILFYQVPMVGHIGVWNVKGIADLIALWPGQDGKILVRIFEIKSSWEEQTAHRIQVAIYALLLSQSLGALANHVTFEGGVINKESDLKTLKPEELPKFKIEPLIQDVERLLSNSGELNRIHQSNLSEVEYRLCWRCDNCGFNECCIVNAVENESVALLNLSRGEQNALRAHGIRRLEDLARLKYVPNLQDQKPYFFKEVRPRDTEKVRLLSADPVIGPKLDRIVQRAQFMLYGIRPSSAYVNRTRSMPWLTGTGYGALPEDSAVDGDESCLLFRPDSMIRIYFHIQWDYMLDVVSMISARISCTRLRGDPVTVSKIITALPDDRDECLEKEKNTLEEFFTDLTNGIVKVAEEVGSPEETPIHLYFYTRRERDVLMEAVRRQPSLMGARAVRDLLGLRQAIDQPMFSIIQDELLTRKALGNHSTGLLPALDQSGYFDKNQWQAKRHDGSTVDLRMVFRDGLFNYVLPFARKTDGTISFLLNSTDSRLKAGFYPARARFGNQIPIEYFWAAKGRIDSNTEKGIAKVMLEKRMWCDYPQKTRRISNEELTLIGSRLCLALEHIERFLNIRNRRLGKKPIPIPKIAEFSLGPATLKRSCREFLDLEYFAKRQELYQHYALLPSQRVATGRSLIFECTGVEVTEQDFVVRGKLVFEGINLPNTDLIANACRVKGSDGSSSGDWMVITELLLNSEGQFVEASERSPSEVEKSARVIVDRIDLRKMRIKIKVVSWPSGKSRKYSAWHNLPTSDPEKARSKYMQLFEVGRIYILDELADDIISERAAKCLDYAENNSLYCLLASFLEGKDLSQKRDCLSRENAVNFLEWMDSRRFPPKPEQRRFIERVFGPEQIVMLQGPPGTGKTETLQLAVLAHVAAHSKNSRCRILMVAPTHKAIHEFVSKLAGAWHNYIQKGSTDLRSLRICRVLGSDVSASRVIDGVEFINYNEDEDAVVGLRSLLMNQEKLIANESDDPPLILCVTPPGMYGLMKKIGGTEPPWSEGFFDLLVVDEASMMRVPELILSGAFVNKNAQILVAGDHRQLPPIMAHDWEREDRRTLEEMAAFLSAQDFLRLLRQEDLGIDRIKCQNKADIPAERLSETHRCHEVVAEFLREWVYSRDDIDFRSDQNHLIEPVETSTKGLTAALKPENVFVLIVHDEAESFQSNQVEARIVEAIVRHVPPESVGIVTPHNAQRGVLKNMLADGLDNVRVDTVERYQGGESDIVIISSTVSDPDYIRTESDFLLNLNRVNVAISRMKKKIIVVASRSIFEFMPQEGKDYDKAILWRGIAQTVGFVANSQPQWKGSLSDFVGKNSPKANVEIYSNS